MIRSQGDAIGASSWDRVHVRWRSASRARKRDVTTSAGPHPLKAVLAGPACCACTGAEQRSFGAWTRNSRGWQTKGPLHGCQSQKPTKAQSPPCCRPGRPGCSGRGLCQPAALKVPLGLLRPRGLPGATDKTCLGRESLRALRHRHVLQASLQAPKCAWQLQLPCQT